MLNRRSREKRRLCVSLFRGRIGVQDQQLALVLGKVYLETKQRPRYLIREYLDGSEQNR